MTVNHQIRPLLEAGDLESALALAPEPFVQQSRRVNFGLVISQVFLYADDTDCATKAAAMFQDSVNRRCTDRSFSLLMLLRAYTVYANSQEEVLPLDHQRLRDRCLPVINEFDRSDPRWAVVGDAVVNDLENRFPWSPTAQPTEDPSLSFIRRPDKPDN